MARVKLCNRFHLTTTTTATGQKTREQMERIKRRLCGVGGCTCGGISPDLPYAMVEQTSADGAAFICAKRPFDRVAGSYGVENKNGIMARSFRDINGIEIPRHYDTVSAVQEAAEALDGVPVFFVIR